MAAGFRNSATGPGLGFLCGALVLVYEAAEDRPALDSLLGEVSDRVIGLGRAEVAAAVGAPPVVMGLVLGQDRGSNDSRIRTFQPIDQLQLPAIGAGRREVRVH